MGTPHTPQGILFVPSTLGGARHLHPRNQSPWTPPHRVSFKKKSFFLFVRVRNVKNTMQVAKFAPSLGPVPLPPTPPGTEALGPPPSLLFSFWTQPSPFFQIAIQPLRPPPTLSCNQGPWFTALSTRPAPVGTPPPHRASFKKHNFFFFLYALETSKIRRKLPSPLPPRHRSPLDPPRAPA